MKNDYEEIRNGECNILEESNKKRKDENIKQTDSYITIHKNFDDKKNILYSNDAYPWNF
jgi:hypothetical protein